MQPARLPTSLVARFLLARIPADRARRTPCLRGVPIPGGNPAWSCMKDASESKLDALSAGRHRIARIVATPAATGTAHAKGSERFG
jgi:hypothetical protein